LWQLTQYESIACEVSVADRVIPVRALSWAAMRALDQTAAPTNIKPTAMSVLRGMVT
jgi:hypothetical protein